MATSSDLPPSYPPDAGSFYRTKSVLLGRLLPAFPYVAAFARRHAPLGVSKFYAAMRYDDVIEAFATDTALEAPYADNLAVVTGGRPFFLGMRDGPEYRAQLSAMRAVVLDSDMARLGDQAEAMASAIVAQSGGTVDVVQLVRKLSFDVVAGYFGIGEPEGGSLAVWCSRLFEFQFTGSTADADWLAEAQQFAAAFRSHVERSIAARKADADKGPDDVLDRCLQRQRQGLPGYSDDEIATALICMIVGGPPQPPMVVPNGIDQLLHRPFWLAKATAAARAGDDKTLHDILFEAMRFDPLAPVLTRVAIQDHVLAAGTDRARLIPKGAKLFVSMASAMRDPRRIPDPERFDPDRPPQQYLHFGHGLHECFGRAINHAKLHRMVKPLLARQGLRRAAGSRGRLRKLSVFADRLIVCFD